MEKPSNTVLKNYEALSLELSNNFTSSSLKKDFYIFCEKWRNIHKYLFNSLKIDGQYDLISEKELNEIIKAFMLKRKAMVSSFAQGIKKETHSKKEYQIFREFLFKHDEHFKNFLAQVLENYSIELIRLQSHRKATTAYMHSHFSSGG